MSKARPKKKAGANDAVLVAYPIIRDRFLARLPDDAAGRLESYVAIGRFVVDRWMAEELTRVDGQPLDEQACWDRWDECTEKHLRDLRSEAAQLLDAELKKGRVGAFLKDWSRQLDPVRGFISVVSWVWSEALRGFVGAIGILVFGLLLVWLQPHLAKIIRSTADDSLPSDTRPADEAINATVLNGIAR